MIYTKELKNIANNLRRLSLISTSKAGSGHPTSCLSCAEIMSVLFFHEMKYDVKNSFNPDNDEFILSKGHAAPILYASLFTAGCVKDDLNKLRVFGSKYEGHPLPNTLNWIKVATGSLGQGLSIGVGMALASKIQKRNFKTYVLLGDSECTEGSIYEALQLGSFYKLNNLVALVDVNRLGQSGETMLGHKTNIYKRRFESFGWNAIVVDGHDVKGIINALDRARKEKLKPTMIIAKTIKGKGVSFLENKEGWHGKTLNQELLNKALEEIPENKLLKINIIKPKPIKINFKVFNKQIITNYSEKDLVATREAYGKALVKLASNNDFIIATDGETKNSTFAEELLKYKPERYIEAYIAEQNMVGMALGLSKKGFNIFASSFASFLTSRAHDQIRMAALSDANFTLVGSHAGISIGEDGPSQMALEDISIMRALPNSIVLYPSDAVSTEKLVELASNTKGLKYIRTTRGKTPIIYSNNDFFRVGDFKIVQSSNKDQVVVVGAGITLHEAIKAYKILKKEGVNIAVIDCYCIKPFDGNKFLNFVKKSGNKVIVVEDHYRAGGIGEMLSYELKNSNIEIKYLNVNKFPHSGKPQELLDNYRINFKAIIDAVRELR